MIWVWHGPLDGVDDDDLNRIVRRAQRTGVGVVVKMNDGEVDASEQRGRLELITSLREAGVSVRAWGTCYPRADFQRQIAFAHEALQAGAERYIVDAQSEWRGESSAARTLVDLLPAGSGYSPPPIIDFVPDYPYREFNALDLVVPQAYAGTGGLSALEVLRWCQEIWRRWWERWQGRVPDAIEWGLTVDGLNRAEVENLLRLASGPGWMAGPAASIIEWTNVTDEQWSVLERLSRGRAEVHAPLHA